MASWNDAPELAPVGDYKLNCMDYIPAGSQGGAELVDMMVIGFVDPKYADKYMPFRMFLNDRRDKPPQLDDDTWASIQERNQQIKELIYEAFGFDEAKDAGREAEKLIGKDTGKNKLRVVRQDRGGSSSNTIALPRNPAPNGDYFLEILGADYKEKGPQDLGMRKWLTLTLGIEGQDTEGKAFTPIRGLDTMVKFCWSKDFKPRDEEAKTGFKSERDYMALVQQDVERTGRLCHQFGLPAPKRAEDADTLYLDFGQDLRALLVKGLKTKKKIRLTQTLDQVTLERYNRAQWPVVPVK